MTSIAVRLWQKWHHDRMICAYFVLLTQKVPVIELIIQTRFDPAQIILHPTGVNCFSANVHQRSEL